MLLETADVPQTRHVQDQRVRTAYRALVASESFALSHKQKKEAATRVKHKPRAFETRSREYKHRPSSTPHRQTTSGAARVRYTRTRRSLPTPSSTSLFAIEILPFVA